MTKRNIYINAPLTRRVLSYFIDWYLGALCAAFPIAVVSQKLYGTMLKQNLLKIQQPYGLISHQIPCNTQNVEYHLHNQHPF